jgi:hypothetical protein
MMRQHFWLTLLTRGVFMEYQTFQLRVISQSEIRIIFNRFVNYTSSSVEEEKKMNLSGHRYLVDTAWLAQHLNDERLVVVEATSLLPKLF